MGSNKTYEVFTGRRYGTFLIVSEAPKIGDYRAWVCRCDCGRERVMVSGSLRNVTNMRCGKACTLLKKSKLPFHNTWHQMIQRCYNKKSISYPRYGGRGISVCEEWKNDFMVFYEWMLKNGATKNLTLDRYPNKNGNYCPENCRLATLKQQQNNTRRNRLYTINGVTKTLSQWCDGSKIKRKTVRSRLRIGWSISDALTKKVQVHKLKAFQP